MSDYHAFMAAQNLQSAVTRYMAWRGIGKSAVNLIPEEVRRPDYYRLESFRFILPPGYRENMGMLYWHSDAHGNIVDALSEPKTKLGVWMVRQVWSAA